VPVKIVFIDISIGLSFFIYRILSGLQMPLKRIKPVSEAGRGKVPAVSKTGVTA
jgi:hypothetical protein